MAGSGDWDATQGTPCIFALRTAERRVGGAGARGGDARESVATGSLNIISSYSNEGHSVYSRKALKLTKDLVPGCSIQSIHLRSTPYWRERKMDDQLDDPSDLTVCVA